MLCSESEAESFECASKEKSVKTILKMEQIKIEEKRKNNYIKVLTILYTIYGTNFAQPKRRPAPKFDKNPVKVKQTAAGILREERMYAKKEEESLKSLEKLLQGT